MSEWQLIDNPPSEKIAVLLYHGHLSWELMSELRSHVERTQIGWFDNGEWYEAGTGHYIFEDWKTPDQLPTHWAPLLAKPSLTTRNPTNDQLEDDRERA